MVDRDGIGSNTKHPVLEFIKGHGKELEILQHQVGVGVVPHREAAPRFRELISQTPEWEYLFERFRDSPKHLVRLLVELYPERFISYNHLYRLTSSINVGSARSMRYFSVLSEPPTQYAKEDSGKRADLAELMTDFEVESRFPLFGKDPRRVTEELTMLAQSSSDPLVKESYARALEHFYEISDLSISAFKLSYQPRLYQAEAILKGTHGRVRGGTSIGMFDEMGTGKTLEALGRIEYLGVERALVIAPAGVKNHWQVCINEYYIGPPSSRIIEATRDIQNGEREKLAGNKFLIVSYDLLVDRNGDDEVVNLELMEALERFEPDGLIVDEAHYANNYRSGTKRAAVVERLANLASVRHSMFLSGTPVDKVRDMDMIAHLLDSGVYPNLNSFSTKNRENPRISHNELLGKIIRRTSKEVLELPPYEELIVSVDLTPTQRALYDFVYSQDDDHPLAKLNNLRKAVLHPRLVGDLDIGFNKEKALIQLGQAYIAWKRKVAREPSVKFDSDFLVTNGFTELYISALVNLDGGVSELVEKSASPLTQEVWKGEILPAKFIKIRQIIGERLSKGEKVVIFSSLFAKGVTRDFPDGEKEYYQYLLRYLQQEFGQKAVVKIDGSDGTVSNVKLPSGEIVSQRELKRRKWQNDINTKIAVVSARASSLGIDMSISDPNITGVSVIFVDLPYTCGGFDQPIARVLRYGQKSPVTTFILEANGTLERDIYNLLQEKKRLLNMLLDAVELTEEEERIWEESPDKIGKMLTKMIRSPRQNIALIFGYMLGKSAEHNSAYLSDKFTIGETHDEYIAKWYDEVFENGYSGYCSQVVKKIVVGLEDKGDIKLNRIADWGSGPLVLSRVLGKPALSLDIGPAMLKVGQQRAREEGIVVPEEFISVGSISDMPKHVFKDNSIDMGVCSLALDCTAPGEERIKALLEMHRSIIEGGYLIVTIPAVEMGALEFKEFKAGFSELGFNVDLKLSGFVKGKVEDKGVFNTWVFVMRKIGQPLLNPDPDKFIFSFEKKQGKRDRVEAKKIQKLANYRTKNTPQVAQFVICEPNPSKGISNWAEKGNLDELLSDSVRNYLLQLSDERLKQNGYKREFIVSGGQEEIRLTTT